MVKANRTIRADEVESEENTTVLALRQKDFTKKMTPVVVKDPSEAGLFLFKCECGGYHYRHAAYFKGSMPYMRADATKHVSTDDYEVYVCVKCRKCYVWINDQVYDVTDIVDLKAWAKLEKELHKSVGPSGSNC